MMVDDDMEEDPFEEEMKSAVKQEIKREPEIKSEPVVEVKQEKRKIGNFDLAGSDSFHQSILPLLQLPPNAHLLLPLLPSCSSLLSLL